MAGDRYAPNLAMGARGLSGHWKDELGALETGLEELESQARTTGDVAAKAKTWSPAPPSTQAPRVEHVRPATARPGEPLRLSARVNAPSGVASVNLRYRHVTQFEDYQTLAMTRAGDADEFTATVPGDFLVPEWDFMYFIEATDSAGQGVQWPDLAVEAPYVIVKLERNETCERGGPRVWPGAVSPPYKQPQSYMNVKTLPRVLFTLGTIALAGTTLALPAPGSDRGRLIVLADMGNEPDEEQQMIHMLICSSEFELDGLIAVTGKFLRPESKVAYKQTPHPELFHRLIDGYAKAYPNLQLHATGWHTPDYLHSIVACGQTGYGIADVGEGKASAGSRLIVAAVDKPDPRPVHIAINAGSNTLAQALYGYRAAHSPQEVKAFVGKLRVFENQAQDDAGAWICREFPDIHWIRSRTQTRCYGGPTDTDLGPCIWRPYDYSPQGQDDWASENVRTMHGALGELYPVRAFGQTVHFIEGGGSIPWLGLVCHGLADSSEPSWGDWSGRYTSEKTLNVPSPFPDIAAGEKEFVPFSVYTDATDRWTNQEEGKTHEDSFAPIWHWRTAMWNDFKARMDWCVQPYEKANHCPHAVLNGDASDAILHLSAKPGEAMEFDASGSTDPDNDALRYSWWIYPEAGRRPYGKALPIANASAEKIEFTIPPDAVGKELHLILEVWDESEIVPLVDYRRVVITINS